MRTYEPVPKQLRAPRAPGSRYFPFGALRVSTGLVCPYELVHGQEL